MFYYVVTAFASGVESAPSTSVAVDSSLIPPVPQAPSEVTATTISSTVVAITWSDNSLGESGFQIHRSSDDGLTWTLAGTVQTDVKSFTDTTAAAATTYLYQVVSTNSGGSSSMGSGSGSGPVPTPPDDNGTGEPLVVVEATQPGGLEYDDPASPFRQPVPVVFSFRRTNSTSGSLTVNFEIGGTATEGDDYSSQPRVIVIPAGQETATLSITPYADGYYNQGEGEDEYESIDIRITSIVDDVQQALAAPAAAPTSQPSSAATAVIADTPPKVNEAELQEIIYPELINLVRNYIDPTIPPDAVQYAFLNGKAYEAVTETVTTETRWDEILTAQLGAGRAINEGAETATRNAININGSAVIVYPSVTEDAAATAVIQAERNSIGAPGKYESLFPFLGSSLAAIHDFQTGQWGWGIVNAGLAISDVFLLKSLANVGGKLLFKTEITATEAAARAGMVQQVARRLEEMTAVDRAIVTAAEEGARLADDAARTAKKAGDWTKYQARKDAAGEQPYVYERWSNVYDANQTRAIIANQRAEVYQAKMGYPDREFPVDIEGVTRRIDMGDQGAKFAVEYKSGTRHTATATGPDGGVGGNLWEVARDEILVEKGWTVEWVFEVAPTPKLRQALVDAGITVKVLTPN